MKTNTATEPAFPRRLIPLFIAQPLATFAAAFVQAGFFFYVTARWGWQPRSNLLLAAGEGATYIVGALLAHTIAQKLGRKGSIVILPLVIGVILAACGIWTEHRELVVGLMMVFTFVLGGIWPALESLVAGGTDAAGMAKRLAAYNLSWPAIGALAGAVSGMGIAHLPRGFFFIGTISMALGSLVVALEGSQKLAGENEGHEDTDIKLPPDETVHEPELVRQRTLALWLSRISLPSTYIAAAALGALMPTLPSLSRHTVSMQTAIGSIWLVGRFVAFCLLAASAFWHTRPRLLIWASAAMLVAFVGICVPVSTFTGGAAGTASDLWSMGIAQCILGASLALIYSASLYFGMVLSDGATEHGGYHEALIGLGQVLGPGVAAAAQTIRPGNIFPAVIAVALLLAISLVACEYAAVRVGGKEIR